jgi:hypothetical protein
VSGAAARTISRLSVKLSDGLKQMIDRREMFALLGAAGAAALLPSVGNAAPKQQEAHHPAAGEEPPANPIDALARLKEGNGRFVSGRSQHSHESASLRHQLVSGQHPFAIVLGCSDSRVPVELIFDQWAWAWTMRCGTTQCSRRIATVC